MKKGITRETFHWISLYGWLKNKKASFDVFAEDIPVTEQEIVLKKEERWLLQENMIVRNTLGTFKKHLVIQNHFSPTVLWEEDLLSNLHTDGVDLSFL